MTWVKALQEARAINHHITSCWNAGGSETCEKCWVLAERLQALTQVPTKRKKVVHK